jgi:hypothetical protein
MFGHYRGRSFDGIRPETPRSTLVGELFTSMLLLVGMLVVAPISLAGTAVIDGSGNFMIIQAHVLPPRASAPHHPQGVGFAFDFYGGNLYSGIVPIADRARTIEIRAPRGFRFNYRAFPACRFQVIFRRGTTACPHDSLIGSGTTVIDGRPLYPDFIRIGKVALFNSRGPSGHPLLYGEAKAFGTSFLAAVRIKPPTGGFGPTFVMESSPDVSGQPSVLLNLVLHLEFRQIVSRGHRRVSLWESPTACHDHWLVELVGTTYAGQRRVATDRIPCIPAKVGRR